MLPFVCVCVRAKVENSIDGLTRRKNAPQGKFLGILNEQMSDSSLKMVVFFEIVKEIPHRFHLCTIFSARRYDPLKVG